MGTIELVDSVTSCEDKRLNFGGASGLGSGSDVVLVDSQIR